MVDRIFYTLATVCLAAAVIIVANEWLKELKEHAASVDNVYPLHRRTS